MEDLASSGASLPPAEIRREPYVPVATSPLIFHAGDIGLRVHARAVVACVPGSGSYVGGDISADVLAHGGDGIDETDLHREEAVRGVLDRFGRCGVGDDDFGVEPPVQQTDALRRHPIVGADDDDCN